VSVAWRTLHGGHCTPIATCNMRSFLPPARRVVHAAMRCAQVPCVIGACTVPAAASNVDMSSFSPQVIRMAAQQHTPSSHGADTRSARTNKQTNKQTNKAAIDGVRFAADRSAGKRSASRRARSCRTTAHRRTRRTSSSGSTRASRSLTPAAPIHRQEPTLPPPSRPPQPKARARGTSRRACRGPATPLGTRAPTPVRAASLTHVGTAARAYAAAALTQ
jgi:hypothetical protein